MINIKDDCITCSSAEPTHRDAVDQPAEYSELSAAVPPLLCGHVREEEKKNIEKAYSDSSDNQALR